LIYDETLQVYESGLHDGAVVTLELSKPNTTANLSLKVTHVVGNSHEFKNTMSEAGVTVREIELNVSMKESVTNLRDLLGVMFCNYVPGWSSDSQYYHRLRKTTLLGDPSELITEVDEKGDHVLLESCGLESSTMIRFEDGHLPIKGMNTYKLFLWSKNSFPSKTSSILCSETSKSTSLKSLPNDTDEVQILETKAESQEKILQEIENKRSSHLLSLGEVTCHEDKTVTDLHELVYTKVKDHLGMIISIH
jgi:hypothetical protein